MKKKILVPVDFSTHSHNAYLYARELANVYDTDLVVVHIFSEGPVAGGPSSVNGGLSKAESVLSSLGDFVDLYDKEVDGNVATKINVELKAIGGPTIKEICQLAKDESILMVVMGKKGTHDMAEKLVGSVSTGVAQLAACPVFLLPKGGKFKRFDNILYASNFESANRGMVETMKGFADKFGSSVHFIHVNDTRDSDDFIELEDRMFDELFREGDPEFSFNMATVNAKTVQSGLEQYAEENNIDLIVLVNRQRNFWDNLVGNSMTKKLALDANYPILVYHIN